MAPGCVPSLTVSCSRIQMRWFLLCSATFLFLAVKNINGSNDNSEELSPLVKELCKYLIHFKRKNFCERSKDIPKAKSEDGPVNKNDTNSQDSEQSLKTSFRKNEIDIDAKPNPTVDQDASAEPKKQYDIIEELIEVQNNISQNVSQNLQPVISLKKDSISMQPESCAVVKKCQNCSSLNSKNENNNISQCQNLPRKCQMYRNVYIICPKYKRYQNISDKPITGCSGFHSANISECTLNCSSEFQIPVSSRSSKHGPCDLCIWPVYMCWDYFLPYFKRCKLELCKQCRNTSDVAKTAKICGDVHLSSDNYNETCIAEPSGNHNVNRSVVSNTTDFSNCECIEYNSTECFSECNSTISDKPCSVIDNGVSCRYKNLSCNETDISKSNNSDPFCIIGKKCSQSSSCEKKCDNITGENISRNYNIFQSRYPQNLCSRCFRLHSCPMWAAIRTMRYCNFINNCNFCRNVPQFFCSTNCLEPAKDIRDRKCIKDKNLCCESISFNECKASTNISREGPCFESLATKQDCNHNFTISNDCAKIMSSCQSCKLNTSVSTCVKSSAISGTFTKECTTTIPKECTQNNSEIGNVCQPCNVNDKHSDFIKTISCKNESSFCDSKDLKQNEVINATVVTCKEISQDKNCNKSVRDLACYNHKQPWCKCFKIVISPNCTLNNCNSCRDVPQIFCNTKSLEPAIDTCERKYKKDKNSCCEPFSLNEYSASTKNSCSGSLTTRQDCNYNFTISNDCAKIMSNCQSCKLNTSDSTCVKNSAISGTCTKENSIPKECTQRNCASGIVCQSCNINDKYFDSIKPNSCERESSLCDTKDSIQNEINATVDSSKEIRCDKKCNKSVRDLAHYNHKQPCFKCFKIFLSPNCTLNNCNSCRNVPQFFCIIKSFEPAIDACEKKCKKDKNSCCEPISFNECPAPTNNSCSGSLTTRQDCNHNFTISNDCAKIIANCQSCKLNISDSFNATCKLNICGTCIKERPIPKECIQSNCERGTVCQPCNINDKYSDSNKINSCEKKSGLCDSQGSKQNEIINATVDSCKEIRCDKDCNKPIRDTTCHNHKQPWCKCFKIVLSPNCIPLRCNSENVCKESNNKLRSQEFGKEALCKKSYMKKDDEKELFVSSQQYSSQPGNGECFIHTKNILDSQPSECKESNLRSDCHLKNSLPETCKPRIITNDCNKFCNSFKSNKEINCPINISKNLCIDFIPVSKSGIASQRLCAKCEDIDLEAKTNRCDEKQIFSQCLKVKNECSVPIKFCQSDNCAMSFEPCDHKIITKNCKKCQEESQGPSSNSCKYKEAHDCIASDVDVSESRTHEIHDPCDEQRTRQNLCEIYQNMNKNEGNEKYNDKQCLCEPASSKYKNSVIANLPDSCKENSDDCSLVGNKLIIPCNRGTANRKLDNLCKIIAIVKNELIKECSNKCNSICDLVQRKSRVPVGDCDNPCFKSKIKAKSELCKCEIAKQSPCFSCENIDSKVKKEKCYTKPALCPCLSENNECHAPIKFCKSDSCAISFEPYEHKIITKNDKKCLKESQDPFSGFCKCKERQDCIISDIDVSKSRICDIHDTCDKQFTSHSICEVCQDKNENSGNEIHSGKKCLCKPVSSKNNIASNKNCHNLCKKNYDDCNLVKEKFIIPCNHHITQKLETLCKIASVVKKVLTDEFSSKKNFSCQLKPKKVGASDNICNYLCTENNHNFKSGKSDLTKYELSTQSPNSMCNDVNLKEEEEKCNIKPMLYSCTDENNEEKVPVDFCKAETCRRSEVSRNILCNKNKIFNKINENSCQNLQNGTETQLDFFKDCESKIDCTKSKSSCVIPKIRIIPCSKKKLRFISCLLKNSNISSNNCDSQCLCDDIIKKNNCKDVPNCKLKLKHCDSEYSEEQCSPMEFKSTELPCLQKLSEDNNSTNDKISDTCCSRKQIEQCKIDVCKLGTDDIPESPLDELVTPLKGSKDFDCKPLSCCHPEICVINSPQQWIPTSNRYTHQNPWMPKLITRKKQANNLFSFNPQKIYPRSTSLSPMRLCAAL